MSFQTHHAQDITELSNPCTYGGVGSSGEERVVVGGAVSGLGIS